MKRLAYTVFRNPVTMCQRGVDALQRDNRFAIHIVYSAGETSGADFDGWKWYGTIEEARIGWRQAVAKCKECGFTEELIR